MKKQFQQAPWPTTTTLENNPKVAIILTLTLILLTIIPLYLFPSPSVTSSSSSSSLQSASSSSPTNDEKNIVRMRDSNNCDIFRGEWVPNPRAPYYTNNTCWAIHDHQNCMKFGRPDTDFLKWRWKPDGCELPVFNPAQFLELVKGKSLAFLGDSGPVDTWNDFLLHMLKTERGRPSASEQFHITEVHNLPPLQTLRQKANHPPKNCS